MKLTLLKAVWVDGRLLGAGTRVGDDASEKVLSFLRRLPDTIVESEESLSPAGPAEDMELTVAPVKRKKGVNHKRTGRV